MYKFLTKNGLVIALGVGVLLIIIHFIGVYSGLEAFNLIPDDTTDAEVKKSRLILGAEMVNSGLFLTIALFVIAAVSMLGFGIFQVVTNPKGALKGIIGLGLLAVIFGFGWAMSTDEIMPIWDEKGFGITPFISKYVGASIWTTVILISLAILGLVGSEVRNFFK